MISGDGESAQAPLPPRLASARSAAVTQVPTQLPPDSLRRLHRDEISDRAEIRRLLERVRANGIAVDGGVNRLTERRSARLVSIEPDAVRLRARGFGSPPPPRLCLRFKLEGTAYFLVAEVRAADRGGLVIEMPRVVYRSERRDLGRRRPSAFPGAPRRAELSGPGVPPRPVQVTDYSRHGLGLEVEEKAATSWSIATPLRVRFLDGVRSGEETPAVLRHRKRGPRGRMRVGLSLGAATPERLLPVEPGDHLFRRPRFARMRDAARRLISTGSTLHGTTRRIEFRDGRGERIRAILDTAGDPHTAPLIVIPPAWGRTKETLLPLALTIVETFRRAERPVAVLRYDGIRRRGESHNDPECLAPGDEYLHFTLSQAVHDLHSVLDFAEAEFQPETFVLVTSSVAAIEGRRAIASDPRGRAGGWVSLVGVGDLCSSLREFSGGVDYGLGSLSGIEFGVQDLLGVRCDLELLVRDALDRGLWFPEDARRDMEAIDVPICWIHGRYDGWMQLASDRLLLSCGDTSRRRLIEIPTGHQLRTSDEALTAFRLVAQEIGRTLTGRPLRAADPDPKAVAEQQRAERRHLPAAKFDLRRFWRDYLVGRRGEVGIELLTATSAYQELMDAQTRALDLREGDRIADLGCGAGDFACRLSQPGTPAKGVEIDAYDFVAAGLARMRERLEPRGSDTGVTVRPVIANLAVGRGTLALPCRAERYDAVLCSLLLSYLEDPVAFLGEARRILKPGGRLVLSCIRRDGDLSKIYNESLRELHPALLRERFGAAVAADIEAVRQTFLSDAARILDLEEFGYFRFWDAHELALLVEAAGFRDVRTGSSLGDPPQAVVLSARTLSG